MSLLLIQTALEKHLMLMAPAIATAWENKAFEPVDGVPHQRVHHLLNNPLDMDLERNTVQERGILQVSVYYPLNGGRVPAMARAQAIRDHFKPVQLLSEGSVTVEIGATPRIAGGMVDGPWWMVPVSISWLAFTNT